mmetsp:Transcript_10626/g.12528  ORF Transcript_10626/g.12528 Transcript_10626/m.12528 type:complete len:87 (+) Transcript_10626:98-358(+)
MKTTLFTVLAFAASASAFAPAQTFSTRTSLFAEEEAKAKETPKAAAAVALDDTNFEDVNVVRVMGLKRVKKMIRKYKRENNQSKAS